MFETLTQAQAIFISSIILAVLFAGIQLRSLVVLSAWSFMGFALVGVMAFGMPIIYFWYMVVISALSVAISMVVFVTLQ